ncbi:MAG: hypothetical protein KBC84_02040 [Proteobacteria bacterium]|nr:hypothetical protein [Pseudomonadota bacterium]
MRVLADTHVHFYPFYDLELWLRSAFLNFNSNIRRLGISPEPHKVIFLTERADCDFFSELKSKRNFLDYNFEQVDPLIVKVQNKNDQLFIVSGKQVVTKEKLEVLVLLSDIKFVDGEGIGDFLASKQTEDNIFVLPWSLGKWYFQRGKIVKNIINNSQENQIYLGDIASRPNLYPEPNLFELAKNKRISIVAGSDPLPISGEETLVGSYLTLMTSEDNNLNAKNLKNAFKRVENVVGHRLSFLKVACRLYKNNQVRRIKS